MKILLLNPPYLQKFSRSQRSPAVIKSGTMYYPIWLAYACGVLEKEGFQVELVDAPATGRDLSYILDLVKEFLPRIVVMDTSTPSIHNDAQVMQAIKGAVPGAFSLFVGPHVSALPENSLRNYPEVDAVARGEYDYTARDLARCLAAGADLQDVLGLSYRCQDGEISHNPARPWIKDLDAIPFVTEVYKRHLRVENYFYSITRYPEVAIITGRGCPYRCTYCMWPQTLTGHGYRRRSVTNVADEFEFIQEELPEVKEVFIEDDTLTVDQKRSVALGEELVSRGNRLPFTANSRADVSYETLYWLKKGGLRLLCVGFESGEQAILDAIEKRIRVEQFYEFRQAARRARVLVHGCFMAGNPGETRETLQKTLQLAKDLDPDTAQFFPVMVYPGTTAYEWAHRNGYMLTDDFRNWLTEDGLHKSIISRPELSAQELVDWCDSARRSFYLRPRFVAAKVLEMITNPRETTRILKAFNIFARYLLKPSLHGKNGRAAASEMEPPSESPLREVD
jgi:anaerobic magnesium-protoporphyrin IX monomethyl ester cyclase